jgi:uncharacterized membrane protein
MPSAQRTIVINRALEDVFAFFADPANDPRWRTSVKEMSASGPVAQGTQIHQVISGPGGRGIAADLEITAYQPPEHYGFRTVAGPVRPTGEYHFAAAENGTSVTFALEANLTGLKKMVMSGQVQKSMDGEMRALDVAKSILESD